MYTQNVYSSLLDSVGYHTVMEYLALQELLSDYIHILAVKKVVSEIDAIHDIHTQLDVSGNIIIIICLYYVEFQNVPLVNITRILVFM